VGAGSSDGVTPTFDITAGGDIAIAKDGFYVIAHYPYDSNRGLGESLSELQIWSLRVAGEQPEGWHPWSGAGSLYKGRAPDYFLSNGFVAAPRWHPMWQDFFSFGDGTFPSPSGPCEIGTFVQHLKDEVDVDDSDIIVKTTIVRYGSVWS
jgi:hypothetical protein